MTQPNSAQYAISDLYLFPVYADRAAYLAATGLQAPPFNAALPLKGWVGSGMYTVFDHTAVNSGYLVEVMVPAANAGVNLPGAYNWAPYVEVPTDAITQGPFGSLAVAANTVCLLQDAQAIAALIAVAYPGKAVTLADGSAAGVFHTVYKADLRRQWVVLVGGVSIGWAQAYIEAAARPGVGAPGHFAPPLAGQAQEPAWVPDTPSTVAPPNAVTVPVPIRALLPNETFGLFPPGPFGSWMVLRTDMQQAAPTTDQQLAALTTALAALQLEVQQLLAKS